jgi:hypothetical protein
MVSIIIIVQLNKEEGKSRQPTKKKREIWRPKVEETKKGGPDLKGMNKWGMGT